MVNLTRVEVVNYQGDISYEMENILLHEFFLAPFIKIFSEISHTIELLDHAQMASIVKKIVNNFDDKWMRVLFHEPDFLHHCLLIYLFKKVQCILRPFESELLLIMLPDGPENVGKPTQPDKVVLISLIGVGFLALFWTTI
jgi:hypothetical protein